MPPVASIALPLDVAPLMTYLLGAIVDGDEAILRKFLSFRG